MRSLCVNRWQVVVVGSEDVNAATGLFVMAVLGNPTAWPTIARKIRLLKVLTICLRILWARRACVLHTAVSMFMILRCGPSWECIPATALTSNPILCRVKHLYLRGMTILPVVASVPMASRLSEGR